MTKRKKVPCAVCGQIFHCGWPIINHQKWHQMMGHLLVPKGGESVGSSHLAGPAMELAVDEEGTDEDVDACCFSVVEYLDGLSDNGTLDTAHVLQYMDWGVDKCDPQHIPTLRFLRAMYGGTGASRRQGQEMLHFIHGISDGTLGIPKTIAACWENVDKVRL
jgi:hypothetical protein